MNEHVDLLVIGGGVNGAGIARDAAGRGLAVALVEKGDLAGATSSSSSKLIHGGLRYLEYGAFRLVREALAERAVLLRIAPHIAWPMRFVLPQPPAGPGRGRPVWMVRLGLFIYDHLGGRGGLPGTTRLDLRGVAEGAPLQPQYRIGFEYSDAWVDDARLVVLNAVDAAERGARVRTRTGCTALEGGADGWTASLSDGSRLHARVVVNAAGPWVDEVLHGKAGRNAGPRARLVKGSHLVTRRLSDGPQAYILQNDDGRVIFVLPYEEDFSLVGTTDIPYEGDPAAAAIDEAEVAYLCRAVSRVFRRPLTAGDVVHTFSGVRPLQDNGAEKAAAVTRDYKLHLETTPAPMLSVFGGKITTYRRLAEHAMDMLAAHFPAGRGAWTATAPLPGGDASFATVFADACRRWPGVPEATLRRMAHAYGTRMERARPGEGGAFGAGLHAAEVDYLRRDEWACTADDVLWRRTKLGLRFSAAETGRLEAAMGAEG